MDPNGLRIWQLADAAGFGLAGTPAAAPAQDLHWRADARLLRLARQQSAPALALAEDQVYARTQAAKPSPVSDPGGSYAWWDGVAGTLRAGGFGEGTTPIALPPDVPPGVPQPTDLAFGADDVLYLARNDGVVMADRRDRWPPARVDLAGFRAQRLAPASGGGVWVLDRISGQLALLQGYPLRITGIPADTGERFRPVEPNPAPPRLRLLRGARLPSGVEAIALAGSVGGRVAVLVWIAGQDAELYTLEGKHLVRRFALQGLRFPYALAWVGEDRVAMLASDGARPAVQAFVYALDAPIIEGATALPMGEIHPLIGIWHGGFCNRLGATPEYPLAGDNATTPGGIRRLHVLSYATYARSGRVTVGPFDSGQLGCVWHRLYVEASVPDHAGIRIWAHADDQGGVPPAPGEEGAPSWSPHLVGAAAALAAAPDAPRAAWCDEASELPFNPGLLACRREPGHAGLFTVLMQRAGIRVRRIEGRWLWMHVELLGDSQISPELAAIRVHGARFSYRDRYLPAFYREALAGPDAAAAGTATPHDFLDRFLGLFEGPLTQLESKVAESWQLTDPAATPETALPWLARWIGIDPDPAETPDRLRQTLRAAPWTARLHGTLGGMNANLELATGGQVLIGARIDPSRPVPRPGQLALATMASGIVRTLVLHVADPDVGVGAVLAGGAVSRGEIIVVEGWRLRRTFATILGADLADEDDPLTLGLAESGNSFVGDTLILGDAAQREVLALFSAELPQSPADRTAVAAFFERLAHRVMILVREGPRTADLDRLRAVAEETAPAHVETTLLVARRPLIVGIASLVGDR